jgi:transaldolase/transaldolase/glucose-6-phosphate isomerase
MNPLKMLWEEFGQAVWLDYIERDLVRGDGLARLVADDGVRGVTSNPSIFKAAIAGGDSYDEQIDAELATKPEISTVELYEALAVKDIQMAADALRPVYDLSKGYDGYVSLEVSPRLAKDTAGTIDEARRLWAMVDRPNLMIKVPATPEGMPAIEEIIASGVNVNVTLIFSLAHYEATAAAYMKGVERCTDPSTVASVASFFVSRVDTAVDTQLEAIGSEEALALRGSAAITNACAAYARFLEIFHGDAFAPLHIEGARIQRPLWASTSSKNPAYSDVIYVEELIGPETVNTIPTVTLDAFRDHGTPRASLQEGVDGAAQRLEAFGGLGIDLDAVTEKLQADGVQAFIDAFDSLIATLDEKRKARSGS